MQRAHSSTFNPIAQVAEKGCLSDNITYVTFGNGGVQGAAGPKGAASGGAGGAGASNNTNSGVDGGDGTAATSGSSGYGGAAGNGGGILMVYAYEYDFDYTTTNSVVMSANGGSAENGENGNGVGGDGGNGGDGADANCNSGTYEMPGAGGKPGYGGDGADAGGGGDGGMPGHIRFYSNAALNDQITGLSASVEAGFRGYGGAGTAHGDNGTAGNNGNDAFGGACLACYPVQISKSSHCNCPKALASIGKAADLADGMGGTMALNGSGSAMYSAKLNQEFDNDVNDFKIDATWRADHSLLSVRTSEITQQGVSGTPATSQVIQEKTYRCVLEGNDPYDVFADLVSDMANSADWTYSFAAHGSSTFGDFSFENDAGPSGGEWHKNGQFKASSRSCDQEGQDDDAGIPRDPEDGKNGSGGKGRQPEGIPPGDGRDGEDYSNSFGSDNVFFEHGITPGPPPEATVGQQQWAEESPFTSLYPNPVSHTLTVQLDRDQTVKSVIIFDLRGREVLRPEYTLGNGQTLRLNDLEVLLPNTYLLKVQTANKTYAGTFSVD